MIFGGSMSWTLAIGQIMTREKKFFNFMFASFLMSIGVCQYYSVLVVTDLLPVYPYLGFLHLPFLCLSGPAFYLCFKSVFWQDFELKKKDVLHSVSVILIILLIIPLVTADRNTKIEVLRNPPSFRSGIFLRTYYSIVISTVLLNGLGYLIAFTKECSFLLSMKYIRKNNVPPILIIVVALLCSSGILYIISVIMNNFVADVRLFYHAIIETLTIILLFTVLLIYYISTGKNNYFHALRSQAEKSRYEKSRIKNLDVTVILPHLKQLMEKEEIYKNESLNLNSLAEMLAIEPYQLSQIINENFNKNFNSFINSYRIDEAKRMLLEHSGCTIVHIAYSVGFNSPAPFYDWFQKFTGESPSKYRKNNLSRR